MSDIEEIRKAKRVMRRRDYLVNWILRHHAVLIGTEDPWGKAYKSPFWVEGGKKYFELRYGRVRMKGINSPVFQIDGSVCDFVSQIVQAIYDGDLDEAIELTAPKPRRPQVG